MGLSPTRLMLKELGTISPPPGVSGLKGDAVEGKGSQCQARKTLGQARLTPWRPQPEQPSTRNNIRARTVAGMEVPLQRGGCPGSQAVFWRERRYRRRHKESSRPAGNFMVPRSILKSSTPSLPCRIWSKCGRHSLLFHANGSGEGG